jgi:hypothetical protein
VPWYQWEHRIDFGPSLSVFPWLAAFHLDGAQRLWVLRHTGEMLDPVLGIYRAPRVRWTRYPLEPPYSDLLHVPLGELFLSVPLAGISWYRASYHGSASLYEYVAYTDPHGDLDGDGVPNDVELASFSNPLLPYGFSPVATATGSGLAPGSVFSVTYSIPGDQGLAYAAPFALLGAFPHHFGGGWFIPVMFQDPLLQLSLQPNVPGLSGTLGVLDGQGMTTAAIAIPPIPGLSGFTFHSCIVTRDPNLPIPFKTVSRAFEWTIP